MSQIPLAARRAAKPQAAKSSVCELSTGEGTGDHDDNSQELHAKRLAGPVEVHDQEDERRKRNEQAGQAPEDAFAEGHYQEPQTANDYDGQTDQYQAREYHLHGKLPKWSLRVGTLTPVRATAFHCGLLAQGRQ
jgi:hypothetical protein